MSRSRLWIVGSVMVMVALVALGWFVGIAPKLAEASAADQERTSVANANLVHEALVGELKRLNDDLPVLQAELAEVRKAMPDDPAIATLLGQLNELANGSGVVITSFTASTPADVVSVPVAAPPAGETPADGAPADGTAAAAAAPSTTPAPVTIAGSQFVSIPVSISVNGDPANAASFIKSLQFGERLVLITDLTMTAPTEEAVGVSTFNGFIYVLRDQAPAATAATATAGEEAQAQQ
ncbi:type 4a pilus biogenesis protein PilO [Diaminobutyricimonas sp. LJ205]|uniref:type 4a pilus biogenesis protein PilO n=1 Tax=Diaminobutyricimonas sp. LJ205 TaxID=2683590 RepID=UPI0012F4EB7D|nr:hypothetical protein [Diaminobutyricimonas sp. LJ205]